MNAPVYSIKLTEGQEKALAMVKRVHRKKDGVRVGVIAGFAGTGKTFMQRVVSEEFGVPQVVTPTGKAALRVQEATGLRASTIHRWIYTPDEDEATGTMIFRRRDAGEIAIPNSRMVVLDEASMVGPEIWEDVLQTCHELDLTLILVGDPFQLAPVQRPGDAPFSTMTPEFATDVGAERVELTEILRQAADSPIIRTTLKLRRNEMDFSEIQVISPDQWWPTAIDVHKADGVIICHKNATRHQLNAGLRQLLHGGVETPQVGEPLLVLRNDYDVGRFNGEVVPFEGWSFEPEDDAEIIRDKWQQINERVRYGTTKFDNVPATLAMEQLHGRLSSGMSVIGRGAKRWAHRVGALVKGRAVPHLHANFGYALTAHKSQGSQWPYALVVVENSTSLQWEDGRRWLYTALTRAEKSVALYWMG